MEECHDSMVGMKQTEAKTWAPADAPIITVQPLKELPAVPYLSDCCSFYYYYYCYSFLF